MKRFWILVGLLNAWHWNGIYIVEIKIPRDVIGVSRSISQLLQFYISEDQLSAHLVGF